MLVYIQSILKWKTHFIMPLTVFGHQPHYSHSGDVPHHSPSQFQRVLLRLWSDAVTLLCYRRSTFTSSGLHFICATPEMLFSPGSRLRQLFNSVGVLLP